MVTRSFTRSTSFIRSDLVVILYNTIAQNVWQSQIWLSIYPGEYYAHSNTWYKDVIIIIMIEHMDTYIISTLHTSCSTYNYYIHYCQLSCPGHVCMCTLTKQTFIIDSTINQSCNIQFYHNFNGSICHRNSVFHNNIFVAWIRQSYSTGIDKC